MRESISYSFLLNIIILFIFVCFAIVMGVLSYYKAFKANTIITETIEKYEGYNCVSAEEIERKLGAIGYSTPFNVTCNGRGDNCMTDENQNYAVVSYNLDITNGNILKYNARSNVYDDEKKYENMNSSYICDENGCATNKHYQYGVYTYMYVDAPVISSVLRIPFFSKTDAMYEFRNFYISDNIVSSENVKQITEVESIFDSLYSRKTINGKIYVNDTHLGNSLDILNDAIGEYYVKASTGGNASNEWILEKITGDGNVNYRTRAMIELLKANNDGTFDLQFGLNVRDYGKDGYYRRHCGYVLDYNKINQE